MKALTAFLGQVRIEWRLQRRRPFVWFCLAGYFLLALGDTIQAGWSASGGAWVNGADTLTTRSIIYSILSVLVAAGVVSEPMARDRTRSVAGMVLTTDAGRLPLALARFAVALTIVLLSGLMFFPGVVLGTFAPGIQPEYIGPFVATHYLQAAVLFIIPNFLLVSALAFAVSSRLQSQAAAYGAAVGFVALWVTVRMVLGQDVLRHDLFARAALLDPFGSIASSQFTMGRTVEENNTLFPPLAGLLLYNRLIWGGVALLLIVLGVRLFPMRETQAQSSGRRRRKHIVMPGLLPGTSWLGSRSPFLRMTAWELRCITRAPGVKLVVLFVAFTLWWAAASAVTHQFSLPSTDLLVHNTGFYFDKVLLLAIVWVAGDLVWRERVRRVDALIDVQPTRDTDRFLSKLAALLLVVLGFWALSIVVNLVYQTAHGYYDYELGLYLTDTFVFKAPYYLFLAVLALTAQVLVRQRYVAMGLVLAVYLSEVLLDALGLNHPIYRYGRSSFFWYSLMDGYGHFWESHLWMLLYWALGAVCLATLGWAAVTRGSDPPRRRALLASKIGRGPGRLTLCIFMLGFVATGSFIWWQSTVLATWPPINADRMKAQVERTLGPEWRGVRQPRVVEIHGEIDLYPDERRFELQGRYTLVNPHDTPIDRVLILAEPWLQLDHIAIPHATQTDEDQALNARVYRLDPPLAPGQETTLTFRTSRSAPRGFAIHAENDGIPQVGPTEVIGNGTSLLNLQLMPAVGYTDRVEHKPVWKRRQYGLPDQWNAPEGEDALRQSHATLHLDWVRRVEMTIRTAPDQTAYHPGTLVRQWTETDGRRAFHYVIDRPSRGWANIMSGRYVESRFERPGIPDVVMVHDPDHTYTIEAFADALQDAIEHFQDRYGPPPFDEFRMVEQSLHFDGMGTRSGMGFASEVLGWKTDLQASGGEDLHAMAAHMMGMTWWGDQVIPANIAGAKVIHAGLPYWSAQLYLHQRRAPEIDLRLRRQDLLEAFRGRSALIDEEVPYIDEFKDSTMLRKKGAAQMLYLAHLIGGPRQLEAVFAEFLDQWRYQPAPYPTARDFVDHLRDHVPAHFHTQLDEIFSHITTWHLSVRDATAEPLPDGGFRITTRVLAEQQRVSGWGTNQTVPTDVYAELTAFGERDGQTETIIHTERLHLRDAETLITWDLPQLPERIVVDRLLVIPDPNPFDNDAEVRLNRE